MRDREDAHVEREQLRILVVAVAGSTHLSGVPRHSVNLVRCLLSRPEVSSVHLVLAPWQREAMRTALPLNDHRLCIHQVDVGRGAVARNLWYYRSLPGLASALHVDLVHLGYPVPVKRRAFACPVVVTLHDLYPYDIPANFGFPKVLFNRAILQQCIHAVDAIACVSESTLERFDIHAPAMAIQKATTIYNCVEADRVSIGAEPIHDLHKEPFLLCVAQHRRNKNVVLAIKIFERLVKTGVVASDTKLVVIGMDGPETARIHRAIRDSDVAAKVALLRGVSDHELAWCYAHCELLLAPSSVEGFGYPIVEAMLHHCRVVCSDIPAFREVGGSYCHYADLQPDAVRAFVEAIRTALSSNRFRTGHVDCFSGARVGEAYMRLYKRLLVESPADTKHRRVEAIPMIGRRQAE